MKFHNPYFRTSVEKKVEQHQPAVVAWLIAQSSNRVITLTELRQGLPAIAPDLSRAVVNQICANIGAHIDDLADLQQ